MELPFSRVWKDSNVRRALLVGCSLQLFQQLIGINTVKFFGSFKAFNFMLAGDLLLCEDSDDVRYLQRHDHDPLAFSLGVCGQLFCLLPRWFSSSFTPSSWDPVFLDRDGSNRPTGKTSSLSWILHWDSSIAPCHWGWLSTFRVYKSLSMWFIKLWDNFTTKTTLCQNFQEQHNICCNNICRTATSQNRSNIWSVRFLHRL